MAQRPYLRGLTKLSRPLRAALVLGVLALVVWVVGASLSVFWDLNVDELAIVLGGLIVAAFSCAGVELQRHRNRWVRGLGVLLVATAVVFVLMVLVSIWYLSLLCENGCN